MASIPGLSSPSSALKPQRLLLRRAFHKPSPWRPTGSGSSSAALPLRSIARDVPADLSCAAVAPPHVAALEKDPVSLWRRYVDWLYQHKALGLFLDVSRIGFTDEFLDEMEPRLQRAFQAMRELEKGAIANPDEGRMVGHYWLRNPKLAPNSFLRLQIENTLEAICKFADEIISAKIKPPSSPEGRFTQILSVGIGGSALGPQFVAEALAPDNPPLKIRFIDNTDPAGIDHQIAQLGPELASSLVIVISKSGGTPETRNGLLEVQKAFREAGLDFSKQMSKSKDSGKKDPAWQYCFLADPKDVNAVTCNFCFKVTKGGIYRAKQHIVGGHRNTVACKKCPEHVKEEIREFISQKKKEKEDANILPDFDEVDNEEDEDDELEEVDSRGRRVRSLSNSSLASTQSKLKKPRTKGPMDLFFTPEPEVVIRARKDGKGKQTTINDAYKKEMREKACIRFARWMYDAGIPFNAVNYDSFAPLIEAIGQYGVGMKPPTYHEVRVPLLKKEIENTRKLMKGHQEEWAKVGCSIMSDGWTDKRERTLINFLVNSPKGTVFVESVDASSYVKNGEKIFQLLDNFVEKIGEANVVQVVTDSASANVMAGRLLEAKRPHLYWTPCAAHCLDLMLEDIFKIPSLAMTFKRAIVLNGYVYNRPGLLNMMRHFTKQKELLRPAKTRFSTAFITLASIHRQKGNLRKMFTSEEWTNSKWAKEQQGKRVAQIIMMPSFWNTVVYALKVSGPLVRVLRLVDGEKKPPMGYIYESMDRAKEAIARSFKENEEKYKDVFEIIDRRWEIQLHQTLHAAGHFLNPEFFYGNPKIEADKEVIKGLYSCIGRLLPDHKLQDQIFDELNLYKKAEDLFGNPMAIRHRTTKSPAEWWAAYGSSTPVLQKFAIKILSLTCSASGCERNWSVFEHGVAITQENSLLDNTARIEGWLARFPMFDWVGGRTSEMSAVGLLPAALQGIDIKEMLSGASLMDEETRTTVVRNNPAALLALCWYWASDGVGSKDMVVLPYKDSLLLFSRYLQQLVMESLGKEFDLDGNRVNQGLTVYGNKGSTDQHAYIQQLREGVHNFFVTFIEVLRDRPPGHDWELEPGVTCGDYLFGMLQGTRSALYANDRESITVTVQEVNPRSVGALVALYERAVGIYASLVNINAYHQPGVEAGKKAAGEVLALQKRVLAVLNEASCKEPVEPLTLDEIADRCHSPEQIEMIYKIIAHMAANDRALIAEGSCGSPRSVKVFLGECNVDDIYA